VLHVGGLARDLREGAALAAESLDRGKAALSLERLRAIQTARETKP